MKDREMDGLNEERIIAIPDSFSLLNSSFLLGIDLISNYNCIDEAIQSVIMMIGNEICFNNNDLQIIILSSKRETHFLFFSYFLNLMKEEKKIRYHISLSQQAMGKEEVAFKSRIHFILSFLFSRSSCSILYSKSILQIIWWNIYRCYKSKICSTLGGQLFALQTVIL